MAPRRSVVQRETEAHARNQVIRGASCAHHQLLCHPLGSYMKKVTRYRVAIGALLLGAVVAAGAYWQVERLRAAREFESQKAALAAGRAAELARFDRAQAMFIRILDDLVKLIERVSGGKASFEQADRDIVLVLRSTLQSEAAPRCFAPAREASLTAINALEQLYRVADVKVAPQDADAANDESSNASLTDRMPPVIAAIGIAQQAVRSACADWLRGHEASP